LQSSVAHYASLLKPRPVSSCFGENKSAWYAKDDKKMQFGIYCVQIGPEIPPYQVSTEIDVVGCQDTALLASSIFSWFPTAFFSSERKREEKVDDNVKPLLCRPNQSSCLKTFDPSFS